MHHTCQTHQICSSSAVTSATGAHASSTHSPTVNRWGLLAAFPYQSCAVGSLDRAACFFAAYAHNVAVRAAGTSTQHAGTPNLYQADLSLTACSTLPCCAALRHAMQGPIWQSIKWLDELGMKIIEQVSRLCHCSYGDCWPSQSLTSNHLSMFLGLMPKAVTDRSRSASAAVSRMSSLLTYLCSALQSLDSTCTLCGCCLPALCACSVTLPLSQSIFINTATQYVDGTPYQSCCR